MFPEWTEKESETNAIQHLRLNELRDHVNQVLFPYLTTITPYFRLVSWLVWVYDRIDQERRAVEEANQRMLVNDYREKSSRYYDIFATADTLHARVSKIEHHGPVGVESIGSALDSLGDGSIDFHDRSFGSPINPTGAYTNVMVNMGLLNRLILPITSTSRLPILVPTDKGKDLALAFEKRLIDVFKPDYLLEKMVWDQNDLVKLGECICLRGLVWNDEESILLRNTARSSVKDPLLYDGFIELTYSMAKALDESTFFYSNDLSRAALYRIITVNGVSTELKLKEIPIIALLAFHELHAHTSYSADAVLTGLVRYTKNHPNGISISTIGKDAASVLSSEVQWHPEKKVTTLIRTIRRNFSTIRSPFQRSVPQINGEYGFETIQTKIEESSSDAPALIAWGCIALLQASCAQEIFDKEWLLKILPNYQFVFSSFNFLEERQALPKDATLEYWINQVVDRIIDQHENVVNDKGYYSTRVERRGDLLYHRKDAFYTMIRGRFGNSVAWLSDLGLLEREQNMYRLSKEINGHGSRGYTGA